MTRLWCVCCILWAAWGCSQNKAEEGAVAVPLRADEANGKHPVLAECERPEVVDQFLVSPQTIRRGQGVRLIVRREGPLKNPKFAVWSPNQHVEYILFSRRLGGPPFGYLGEFFVNIEGIWRIDVFDDAVLVGCKQVTVGDGVSTAGLGLVTALHTQQSWTPAYEDFYALFVELLFSEAEDLYTSWPQLSQLLQNYSFNILHDHIKSGEDSVLNLAPIGIDLSVMLRDYFAFKLNLPLIFGGAEIKRNVNMRASLLQDWLEEVASRVDIKQWLTNEDGGKNEVYNVGLERRSLGPGVMFMDWHGHVFVVVRWVLGGEGGLGALWIVEAKSGGKIETYDFWRGRVLWTQGMGGGFKRFRPIVWEQGVARSLKNFELNEDHGWVPWDGDVGMLAKLDWYQEMDFLIEPGAIDVTAAQLRLFVRLERLLRDRVKIIDALEVIVINHQRMGRLFSRSPMPNLDNLFSGSNFWETYSTPARDMRILIALDNFLQFPNTIKLNPARFGLKNQIEIEDALSNAIKLRDNLLNTTHLSYMRSDGSSWTLTFFDIAERMQALEAAYNPNDCPETRWGAPTGGEEIAPCQRRSPTLQLREMERHRVWFHNRERPPLSFLR